jgi:hypothetical protein
MGVGRVQMIVRRIGASTGAKAAAILFRHARCDGGMILHNVPIPVNDFMFSFWHRLLLKKQRSEVRRQRSARPERISELAISMNVKLNFASMNQE